MVLDLDSPAVVAAFPLILREHGLVQLDLSGQVTACTVGFADTVGMSVHDVSGCTFEALFRAHEGTEFTEALRSVAVGRSVTVHLGRRRHDGVTVSIDATLAPVHDAEGRVTGALMLADDVTHSDAYVQSRASQTLLDSFARTQAVIEFTPKGEIVTANDNFLNALGYRLDEIKGNHHRMFVEPSAAAKPDYAAFWAALARGESQTGEFKRIGKSGQPVYIVATYTAVADASGQVTKVVKFATDVTGRKVAVDALVAGIARMAEGDLTARIEMPLVGEFETVREVFNSSVSSFGAMVDEIRARADAMNSEAGAIAQGADDLARRGESQAAALEQTAAAVEQISGNVSMTSQSARDADASARSAQDVVSNGAEIVNNAIAAMERIDEHTRNMAEFTRVIENFAFQTNLLSINAAVEAARAGEVGRGFAVVANEVRNLAQQSAKASQSIAELIGQSEAEVTTGVRLVKDAGAALDQIRGAVGAMVKNIAGIAHATTEQATGAREVSEALSQLDSVNQSNLSLSDQNATAAGSLSTQVVEMTTLLGRFQTLATMSEAYAHDAPMRRSA